MLKRFCLLLAFLLPLSAASEDSSFARAGAETGGQVFNLKKGDSLKDAMSAVLPGRSDVLMLQRLDLSTGPKTITFPVDSFVQRINISLSTTERCSPVMTIFPPSGAALTEGPGAHLIQMATLSNARAEKPLPGLWTATISGSGPATLHISVQGEDREEISFYRFEFVTKTNDIHGGFLVAVQPAGGTQALASATVFGKVATAQFVLISDTDESPLEPLPLSTDYPDASPDDWVGEVAVPRQTFRVLIRGTDANGAPFERVLPRIFRPNG